MLNEKDQEVTKQETSTAVVTTPTNPTISLTQSDDDIINQIIDAPDKTALQAQFDLFNINQSKKNALRVIKLNKLLDHIEDQAIERFERRPDQVSNRELLDYMQVVSSQIDRSQKYVDTLEDKPMINLKQQNTEVNINVGPQLDREGKERVLDAISALLKQVKSQDTSPQSVVIEGELADTDSEELTGDSDYLNEEIEDQDKE